MCVFCEVLCVGSKECVFRVVLWIGPKEFVYSVSCGWVGRDVSVL